jgi:hypothetical protein
VAWGGEDSRELEVHAVTPIRACFKRVLVPRSVTDSRVLCPLILPNGTRSPLASRPCTQATYFDCPLKKVKSPRPFEPPLFIWYYGALTQDAKPDCSKGSLELPGLTNCCCTVVYMVGNEILANMICQPYAPGSKDFFHLGF